MYLSLRLLLLAVPSMALHIAQAQSPQDSLFQRALKATTCSQTLSNGRICKYEFGNTLSITIKDVGGTDTVVGFQNSNINNELYAVLYFACVVIVPGAAHPRSYDRDYGVHISPKTGLVYKSSAECRSSL